MSVELLIVPINIDPLLRFIEPNVPVFKIEFVPPDIVPEFVKVVNVPPLFRIHKFLLL